jgi:hypothetical protein
MKNVIVSRDRWHCLCLLRVPRRSQMVFRRCRITVRLICNEYGRCRSTGGRQRVVIPQNIVAVTTARGANATSNAADTMMGAITMSVGIGVGPAASGSGSGRPAGKAVSEKTERGRRVNGQRDDVVPHGRSGRCATPATIVRQMQVWRSRTRNIAEFTQRIANGGFGTRYVETTSTHHSVSLPGSVPTRPYACQSAPC